MRNLAAIILLGTVTILVFDTAASVISQSTQINYAWFIPASLLIEGTFGFLTARRVGFGYAPVCGAVLGLVDSTIGWYISSLVVPNTSGTEFGPLEVGVTIVFVVSMASFAAFVGGLLAKLGRH